MAVVLTDNRTILDEADATTGWVGTATPSVYTADPNPIESTGSLGMAVSTATEDLYYGFGATDYSSTLIYVWVLANGTMDILANGGIGLLLYDGTNRIGYHLAGSDVAVFRHSDGPVGWQCLVLDTANLPTSFTVRAGAEASLNTAALTGIGSLFKTLSKALGGTENCFTDIIRVGNTGITITGGGPGTEGNFSEIAVADRSTGNQQAYGILRELGTGLFGAQGPFSFGDSAGTGSVDFLSTNETVVFEDRDFLTSRYYVDVVGNTTGTTTFQLGLQVGTSTSGSDGTTISVPSGVGGDFNASDANVDFVYLYGSTLSGFSNGILFSADATNGPNHEVYGCTFTNSGQIDPGKVQFKNNSISGTTAGATGALLLDADGTSAWADLIITSSGTGHGIYITATGTYTFDNIKMIGYGATGTTDAAIYNNSGGSVTINATNGSSGLTYRNGGGASTTINNAVTLTITCKNTSGLAIQGIRVRIETDPGGTLISEGTTNASGIYSDSYNYVADQDVKVVARLKGYKFNSALDTITTNGLSVPFTMIRDTSVNLP